MKFGKKLTISEFLSQFPTHGFGQLAHIQEKAETLTETGSLGSGLGWFGTFIVYV